MCEIGLGPGVRGSQAACEAGRAELGAGIYCNNGSSPTIEHNVITQNVTEESEGAGIRCEAGSSPIIQHNTISDNEAKSGAGIVCRHDSSPLIENNIIAGNEAERDGGGINCYYSAPEIRSNTIVANRASAGGAILTYSSSTRIEGNIIAANHAERGGGIYCTDTSPTIEGNTIAGNTADVKDSGNGGGAFFTGSSVAVTNNAIVGNYAVQGGGAISCYDSSLAITNNTLSRNRAGWGGGVWSDGCAMDVDNCVLWDNPDPGDGPQVLFSDPYPLEGEPNTVAARYSDVEGGTDGIDTRGNGTLSWGDGNFDAEPLFAHGPSGVWSIQPIHDSIAHQSVLTDWTASWETDSLAGLLLNPDTSSQTLQFPIVSNTATTITVWGDVSSIAGAGEPYEVCDYHLRSEAGRW